MDTKTGSIAMFETEEDARKAGYDLPLKKEDAERLMPMNRQQRRAWAAKQRKAQRKAKR